jgi:hypothetical protein
MPKGISTAGTTFTAGQAGDTAVSERARDLPGG